jgi:hypothetical protein
MDRWTDGGGEGKWMKEGGNEKEAEEERGGREKEGDSVWVR